ncbi:hypothetical protein A1351_21760 [Methylosinus sp. R-45379]|nr:hypothetical protein A1351_21760 [Methylosinus sp. R-45379]
MHALAFARKVGASGKVWAFEPDPVNGLILRLNVLQSGLQDIVVPYDVALSDHLAIRSFRTYPLALPENFAHAGVDDATGTYPRIAVALDELFIEHDPVLIKIDAEGHDLCVLQGLRALLKRASPVVSIEAETQDYADAISQFMSALSYDVYDFVTDAFNPRNYAGYCGDIWSGAGKCINLLCVVRGKHVPPENMPLRSPTTATIHEVGIADTAGDERSVLRNLQNERDALVVELTLLKQQLNSAANNYGHSGAQITAPQSCLDDAADVSRAYAVATLHIETLSLVRHEQDLALAAALREMDVLRENCARAEAKIAELSAQVASYGQGKEIYEAIQDSLKKAQEENIALAAMCAEARDRAESQQASAAADFARFRNELRVAREEAAAARALLARERSASIASENPVGGANPESG